MRRSVSYQFTSFGESEPGFLCVWGSAARDKTQPTLGVSTPAAPHQKDLLASARHQARTGMSRPTYIIALQAGFGGLLAGLLLLDGAPIFGVLGMLGSMALLLVSLIRF